MRPKTPAEAFVQKFTQWSAAPEIQEANRRAKKALDAYLDSDEYAALKTEANRAAADWRERHGEPFPTSVESILRLGVRAGCAPQEVLSMSPSALLAAVEGWLERIQDIEAMRQAESGAEAGAKKTGSAPAPKEALGWRARAIAILADKPRMKVKDIAALAGVHPKTLSGDDIFKDARRAALKGSRANVRRGTKNAETGDVEAYADDDFEAIDERLDAEGTW